MINQQTEQLRGIIEAADCDRDRALQLIAQIDNRYANLYYKATAIEQDYCELMNQPPCRECGAMDPTDAETRCICGGDKDSCHGTVLWG